MKSSMSIIHSPQVLRAFPPVEKVRAYLGREGFIDFPVWLDVIRMVMRRPGGNVLYTPFQHKPRYQHGKFKCRFIQGLVTKAVTIPTELALVFHGKPMIGFGLFDYRTDVIRIAFVFYSIENNVGWCGHSKNGRFRSGFEIDI